MYKQLIMNVADHETRIALLEDGTIVELYVDRGDDSNIAGNIYKGKVLRVLPGMQAAFVDIGVNQAAFIYVDDIYHDDYKEYGALFNVDNDGTGEEAPAASELSKRDYLIEELLSEGQEILVQVAKAPIGT
ncbi:MAG: S1 RNA-binding domain-containing protein, partial [Desulfobacterales bacterium]